MEKEGQRDVFFFFDSPLLPSGWRPMPVLPALIWNPAAGLKEKNTEDLRMTSPKLVRLVEKTDARMKFEGINLR